MGSRGEALAACEGGVAADLEGCAGRIHRDRLEGCRVNGRDIPEPQEAAMTEIAIDSTVPGRGFGARRFG